ncbi:MAG: hypothetical protein EHM61_23665 [Acidobacteria bacterium]|nr:MAG: hypothetical protein EHM61_23665 [Acidobacteriota bacterium]
MSDSGGRTRSDLPAQFPYRRCRSASNLVQLAFQIAERHQSTVAGKEIVGNKGPAGGPETILPLTRMSPGLLTRELLAAGTLLPPPLPGRSQGVG